MHVLTPADDRIDGTSLDAFRAADAVSFDDDGHQRRLVQAPRAVVGQGRHAQESRERADRCRFQGNE